MHKAHGDRVLQGQRQGLSAMSRARLSTRAEQSGWDHRREVPRRHRYPLSGTPQSAVPSVSLRTIAVLLCTGLLALAASASASAAARCGSVSYTIPNTHNQFHAALNNLVAVNVSCQTARSVAKAFLMTRKAPKGWHASTKTVVTHLNGQANTVSEEFLTRRTARVTGDIAN